MPLHLHTSASSSLLWTLSCVYAIAHAAVFRAPSAQSPPTAAATEQYPQLASADGYYFNGGGGGAISSLEPVEDDNHGRYFPWFEKRDAMWKNPMVRFGKRSPPPATITGGDAVGGAADEINKRSSAPVPQPFVRFGRSGSAAGSAAIDFSSELMEGNKRNQPQPFVRFGRSLGSHFDRQQLESRFHFAQQPSFLAAYK